MGRNYYILVCTIAFSSRNNELIDTYRTFSGLYVHTTRFRLGCSGRSNSRRFPNLGSPLSRHTTSACLGEWNRFCRSLRPKRTPRFPPSLAHSSYLHLLVSVRCKRQAATNREPLIGSSQRHCWMSRSPLSCSFICSRPKRDLHSKD